VLVPGTFSPCYCSSAGTWGRAASTLHSTGQTESILTAEEFCCSQPCISNKQTITQV
jgi:hypothetical protein